MNSTMENDLSKKQKVKTLMRIFVGPAVGIICGLYLDWKWLFIIISGYSCLETIWLFSVVRRMQFLKAEFENQDRELTELEKARIIGHATGYAIVFALGQFFLSFFTIALIGSVAKLLIELL